ncbi:adenosylcobinamide-phosphate synthase [Devosia subaequoris]|uniref:Cobalamin biosynthesis protein CobD n=1 Tax=Devosia subaequoris TaxID=395930 RepID=A0A7W6NC40_9HYPH|nr:adenosylcobinamide-phosphate synthase CbiB [Devosia subaequoris]MBB4053214.1 adenosylcobinamide-phosphate synthase [Devosia subaequoris]MCP1210655.1 adenosylcobinamide-phosphate synthase CbiB [Devosia subaequoris]
MDPLISPLALAIERQLGYPQKLLESIGHPVMWFGKLISFCEQRLNTASRSSRQRKLAGIVALGLLLLSVLIVTIGIRTILSWIPLGWALEMLLATAFLAQKELGRAVEAVSDALRTSLAAGRDAVSHVVGRDPQALDEAGVARAAVETLAESTSDGVVSPWLFLVLFGLPGIAVYKAVNTADSMIGHRDERYRDYGWAAARLDDLLNWIPARLSAVLITAACFFTPGASPGRAWATARRDASKHDSPNAGWPEAGIAGALGFQLGGPRSYDGEVVDLPAFGSGKTSLGPSDILLALLLYRRTLDVLLGLSCLLALMALLS